VEEFEERFGLTVRELYGSVEANIPVTNPIREPRVRGSCGRLVREFDLRIADEWDDPVDPGRVGEMLIRPKVAFTTMTEYFGAPDATAAAMRNGWFHSGDLGRVDAEGNVYFCGRAKEVIRRRGENISAFEVEEAVLLSGSVAECAALGVPSELSEEDVLICVAPREGTEVDEGHLIAHCRGSLGAFQVPRYVAILRALPKTPTGKIDKGAVKLALRSARVWDGETNADHEGLGVLTVGRDR
jgi:crotonobetaine/carnitine-CoA ligase